ncbi:unnamed protein product [Camellia sinensis]
MKKHTVSKKRGRIKTYTSEGERVLRTLGLQSIESVEIETHGSRLMQSASFLNKAITLSIESICNLLRLGLGFNF